MSPRSFQWPNTVRRSLVSRISPRNQYVAPRIRRSLLARSRHLGRACRTHAKIARLFGRNWSRDAFSPALIYERHETLAHVLIKWAHGSPGSKSSERVSYSNGIQHSRCTSIPSPFHEYHYSHAGDIVIEAIGTRRTCLLIAQLIILTIINIDIETGISSFR